MKRALFHRACGVVALIGAALSTLACTLSDSLRDPEPSPTRASHAAVPRRIAQLHYGSDALYGICIEPACPARTPKTAVIRPTALADSAAQGRIPVAAPTTAESTDASSRRANHAAPPPPARIVLHFANGAAELDAVARDHLDRLLTAAPQVARMTVVGRTDSSGSARVNDALARARAAAVHDYLRERLQAFSVPVTIEAKGACCFVSSNRTSDGRHANRRVEVLVTWRS